jgi:leucyl aminopeptidase
MRVEVRFGRKSDAPVRAIPVPAGGPVPKSERAAAAGFKGRPGEVAEVGGRKRRVLLLGMGAGPGRLDFEVTGALAIARLKTLAHVAIDARGLLPEQAAALAAGAVMRSWYMDRHRTQAEAEGEVPERIAVERLDIMVEDSAAARAAWAEVSAGVEGAMFARDLVFEPGNVLNPAGFVTRLRALEADGIEIDVLDAPTLLSQGMGGMLAVGGGSVNPPCLAVLRWAGTSGAAPVAFVGKGITFDTGGVCIKPANEMWDMRADMAGAAAAAGVMLALARRKSSAPAIAVLAISENAFGAASYRPSDVVRLYDGTTVEIVDTDAEGRLVLADALGWTKDRVRPAVAIDLATLTGSIVTALGCEMAGLFTADDGLAADVAAAGASVGEAVWRMPLAKGYREVLESDIADVRQCSDGTRQPDACHAAVFLQEFVGGMPWVHLDIAGVEAQDESDDRVAVGPTGWGVRLLDRLVADRFET